jgi:mRNA-degrading endonuclease toxin of MazEF toxin-antitoxin module
VDRGEIWHVDLNNPTRGREQANPRYVLILTPREFNALGTPVVAPITSGGNFARDRGFAVSLSGAGTNAAGVVLCNQLRALDLRARNARFSERVPESIMDEVLARILPLFE